MNEIPRVCKKYTSKQKPKKTPHQILAISEKQRLNNIKPYRNKNEVGSKEFGQKPEIRKEICPSTNKDKNKIKGKKWYLRMTFTLLSDQQYITINI